MTGPALVWMALDQGRDFASAAAVGAVLAGAACAVFALTYARASLALARWPTLAVASVASLPPLGLLWLPQWLHVTPALHTPHAVLALAFCVVAAVCLTCLMCLQALPQVQQVAMPSADQMTAGVAARSGLTTITMAGAVSALTALLAPHVSPTVAGTLASLPLLAAAVVWELHRQPGCAPVLVFLRGYTTGLVGRCGYAAAFSALLPTGLMQAVAAGCVVVLVLGWLTARWKIFAPVRPAQAQQLSDAAHARPAPAP